MAVISKIYNSIDECFARAVSLSDDGDYVGALSLFQTARRMTEPYSEDDLEILIEMGETYFLMGLYKESNKIYLEVLGFTTDIDDVYFGLMRNFSYLDEPSLMSYYLNMGKNEGAFGLEADMFISQISRLNIKRNFQLVKSDSSDYLMGIAKQFMSETDKTYAKQMFEELTKRNEHFIEASCCLALIELSEGNLESGIKHCDLALKRDENNIGALTTKCIGLKMQGSLKEAEQILCNLDELLADKSCDDFADYARIAVCSAEIGDNRRVEKYTSLVLGYIPFDREMLILNALSSFNLGNRKKAKQTIVKYCIVYPDDFEGTYFSRLIDKTLDGEVLSLQSDIDIKTCQDLARTIELAMQKYRFCEEFLYKAERDSKLKDAIKWAMGALNGICVALGVMFADSDDGFMYVNKLLTNPDCPVAIKKVVFTQAISYGYFNPIRMTLGTEMKSFEPKIPSITGRDDFINAYWKVYGVLAFITTDFEKKLSSAYKRVYEALKGKNGVYNEDILSAVLAYKAKLYKIFSEPQFCCEVFNCNLNDFMLYCKKVDAFELKKKTIASKAKGRISKSTEKI